MQKEKESDIVKAITDYLTYRRVFFYRQKMVELSNGESLCKRIN